MVTDPSPPTQRLVPGQECVAAAVITLLQSQSQVQSSLLPIDLLKPFQTVRIFLMKRILDDLEKAKKEELPLLEGDVKMIELGERNGPTLRIGGSCLTPSQPAGPTLLRS